MIIQKGSDSMANISDGLEEWKRSQGSRLPKILLPCPTCKKEVEVSFDPPLICPSCTAVFLEGRPVGNRLLNVSLAIFALGFVALFFWI